MTDEAPLSVHIALEEKDFWAFSSWAIKRAYKKSWGRLNSYLALVLASVLATAIIYIIEELFMDAMPIVPAEYFLLSLFLAALLSQIQRMNLDQEISQRMRAYLLIPGRGVLLPSELKFDAAGVSADCQQAKSWRSWTTICEIEDVKDYIFILFSPAEGYVIPKRVFASDEECLAFSKKVNELWKAA